nr:hypothetical protein [Tanacetum cinerariifolium]
MPHDLPLLRVHILGSDEGKMQHNKLMDLVTKLTDRVLALETDLQQTKKVYSTAFTKLIIKVKKLEKIIKSNKARRRANIVMSDDEDAAEDSSKQGRKIDKIDQDPNISLVQMMQRFRRVMSRKLKSKPEQTTTKLQQRQERAGYEATVRLQEHLDEEERQRIAMVHEEASSFNVEEWEDIQATIKADEELALRIQAEEREKYSEAEKEILLVDLINQRKDDLVKLWDLVKERFNTTEPTDDKKKELWVELKRLFEPDNDDTLWKLQRPDDVIRINPETVSRVKDIKEKDKIGAKTGQNQEQTESVKNTKVNRKSNPTKSKPPSLKRDRIICDLNKTPDLFQEPSQNCPKCGNPVDGQYCQGCALLRKKFKEDLFTYCIENGILQDFQDTSEPSNDNTNVVNALQEPFSNKTPVKIPHKVFHKSTTIVVTGVEPDNSLSMGDEHLDTTPAMESDEFIKSSVKNLVPNPSESEGEHECDVSACQDFTTFSNLLFDADDDFSSSNDQLFSNEDSSKKIYSNPLFDEEIICIKIDLHHFNAESDLIESLLNHDSLIISSSKIDYLLYEFAGELTLLKSIPPGIDETDCDREEEICLIKRLFNSFMEKIDLSFTANDPMPPGIEEDDYDYERDILILEELLSNDSFSLLENESFHFDIPSSSRLSAKPLDGNLEILNVKVMGDIFEHKVPLPRLMLTLVLNQEKSPNLLSHQGHEAS